MADVITIGSYLDASGFVSGATKIEKSSDKMAKNINQDTKKSSKSFNSMAASIKKSAKSAVSALNPFRNAMTTIASGVGFGAMVAGAASFEKKMKEVSTLLSDTSGMDKLTAAAQRLSVEFGNSSQEQASALYQAISAGASTAAQAIDVLTVSNKLAIGGVTDVETAVDGLTNILNAYGVKAGTATDVSDSFFVAMKAGKTTITELAQAVGLVAPLAEATGVSVDELNATIATLTKGGIKTRVATAGLRAVLAALVKPTEEAATEAERLGLAFDAESINRAGGFQQFMQDVIDKTNGSTESIALLFGGVEAIVPMLRLAGTGAADYATIMEQMGVKAGETDTAVKKMQSSFAFKWDVFTSTVRDLAEAIGSALLPAMTSIVGALTTGIKWIRSIGDEFMLLAKIVAIGGALSLGLKALPVLMWSIGAAAGALTTGLGGLSAAFIALKASAVTGFSFGPTIAQFGLMQSAMAGLAAAAIGWEIGKYLREEFVEVRIAGIEMVRGLMIVKEKVAGWYESMKAIVRFDFDYAGRAAAAADEAIAAINKEFDDQIQIAMSAELEPKIVVNTTPTVEAIKDVKDSGGSVTAAPKPDQDALDFQKKINDLLDGYAKKAALGSDATELQRMSYALLNGELQKANASQREQLLLAAQQADQNALNEKANQIVKEYAKVGKLAANATEEQRIEYALLNTELKNLDASRKEEIKNAAALADKNKLIADTTQRISELERQTAMLSVKTSEGAIAFERTSGSLTALNGEMDGLGDKLQEAARAYDDAKFAKEARALEESVDPAKRYAAAIEHLNMLRERGSLSADAYSKAVTNELVRTNKMAATVKDNMGGFFKDVINGTESMSDAFKKMGDNILQSFNDIISEQLADQLFESIVKTSGSTSSSGGGGSWMDAISGFFSGGGGGGDTSGGGGGGWMSAIAGAFGFANGGSAPVSALAVPGYANGGDFRVGGSGGLDSQLVAFKASPNETVNVSRPQDSAMKSMNVTNHFNISASDGRVSRESQNQIAARVGRSIDSAMRRNT